jgi:hypothetical protein
MEVALKLRQSFCCSRRFCSVAECKFVDLPARKARRRATRERKEGGRRMRSGSEREKGGEGKESESSWEKEGKEAC